MILLIRFLMKDCNKFYQLNSFYEFLLKILIIKKKYMDDEVFEKAKEIGSD